MISCVRVVESCYHYTYDQVLQYDADTHSAESLGSPDLPSQASFGTVVGKSSHQVRQNAGDEDE